MYPGTPWEGPDTQALNYMFLLHTFELWLANDQILRLIITY